MDTRSTQPDKFGWDDERISAYLDGELTAAEQGQFEKELSQNSELNQLVEELRVVRQQLEQLPQHKLTSDFANNVLIRAAHEILAESQIRSEQQHSDNNLSNGVLPTQPDQIITSSPSSVAAKNSGNSTPRNIRPLIWSVIALAAGLMLLITNSERPFDSNANVAMNNTRGGRAFTEDKILHDESNTVMRALEKKKNLGPNVTWEFEKESDSEKRPAKFGESADNPTDSAKAPTSPIPEGESEATRTLPPLAKAPINTKDASELYGNNVPVPPIAKTDSAPLPRFSDGPTTPPLVQSEALRKFAYNKSADIANKDSDGDGINRNDFDKSNTNGYVNTQRESPPSEEMFVVQMTCEPKTIQNRSFDKLLRDNQIAIANEIHTPADSRGMRESGEAQTANVMRRGTAPLMKAPATDKYEVQPSPNGSDSKSSDSKNNESLIIRGNQSKRGSEIAQNSKECEVVMIEMDRSQFDRLMSEVCNKTDEYANVQIAQAPSQSRFETLNNFVDAFRFTTPSQIPANPSQIATNPFDTNVAPNSAAPNGSGPSFSPNTQLGSNVLPGVNEANKSSGNSIAAPIAGSIGQSSLGLPVTPSLTQSVTQSANAPNPAPSNFSDPASGGFGGSVSQNSLPVNGVNANNQTASQNSAPQIAQQQQPPTKEYFFTTPQLNLLNAAQRLEFSEVDNTNVKDASRNRYSTNSKVAEANQSDAVQRMPQYAGKVTEANRSSLPQKKLQFKSDNDVADLSGTNPNSQQVQPLMKAPAPPASMSQSVSPKLGKVASNEGQPPSQAAIPNKEPNEQKSIAANEEGKSGLSKAGEASNAQGIAANDNQYLLKEEGPESINASRQQKELGSRAKLGKKVEDVASNEKSSNQGQAAGTSGKPESSEQFNQKSKMFDQQAQTSNQPQAPLSKPSSSDYTQNQQQNTDQWRSQALTEQGQLFALKSQQQFGINIQANGRVRAVFILQKKPTQEVNPEPARSLSK